uniref:Amino acid adenylation domain-containing protein n=1 Tax=Candidatus Kentrum sp. FW TaxID=2126338 RepID=A0A450SHS1_9GAMM|nr:MAG: amino acid adenylation domain-containing protein [Candidatus Kentron sp. FW]
MANIEAIYPLTPMQQGMLFHTLYDPESGQYFEQMHFRLQGDVDTRMLEKAWQVLVDRHSALRTAFRYGGDNPVQIVLKQAEVPWTEYDWREFTQEERRQKRDRLLEAERRRGFDFASPPLMRFQIIREVPDSWRVLWHHHHALMDGWSRPILLGELSTVYTALHRGEAPRLPPVNRYQNYIAWLVQQDQQAALDYWRKKLAGFDTPTPIPIIQQREQQSPDHHEAALTLSSGQTHDLNRFAREQRVTLNTLVQAAWAILLGRYSGEDDVVFGATTSGRSVPIPGIETMVGLFINTLPLRAGLDGDLSTLLHALQSQQQQDNRYAYTSLADIQLWSDIPGGVALFDSIIVFENSSLGDALERQDELPFEMTDIEVIAYSNYPITLMVLPAETLGFKLTFDQNRIDPGAITRLLGQLEVLLGAMVQGPKSDIHRLPILTEAERQRVLVEWNDTKVPYPQDKCIHELFEEQVAKTPDAVAVVFEDEEVSYFELNARANRLAHRLRSLGVGPEVLVGLFVERSVEMVVGLLAILKAGGAYVPLDPEYPAERLAFMAEDADLKVLLCHGVTRERLPECAARILELDEDAEGVAGEDSENPARVAEGNNLAYVIYTSGSTGTPKGCANDHKGIVNRILWMQDEYRLTQEDAIPQKTPFSFDVSVWEFLWPLMAGARLVVAKPGGHKDPIYLTDLIGAHDISVMHFVPSMLSAFLGGIGDRNCPSLRDVICSGEALTTTLQEQFFSAFDARLHNLYGPTEAAIDVTYWQCREESALATVPIGRPIANTQLYILDPHGRPVPIGVSGELYIGGAGVARGYFNRPDLTAERFIPDPFSDEPNARLYRTGDLCRWLPDGTIEYLSRIDTQVKIRGFRIECGEVENALLAHPDVREAVVDARGEGTDKQLVAWVGAAHGNDADDVGATGRSPVRGGRSPLRDELRAHLRASLPDWMVPSVFVFVDTLPLTPSGKIDRRALPVPEASDLPGTEYIAPISPTEELLAGVWAAVLKRETIGRFDNFFDLGGHSLLATQLISRIRDNFDVELPVRAIFEQPVLSTLAEAISSSRQGMPGPSARDGNKQALPPIEPQPADSPRELSFAQQRLWFLDRFEEGSSATYNMPAALRLEGALDIHALQSSLHWMVERHESLRMTFPDKDGAAHVEILPTSGFEFPLHDLRHLSPPERNFQQQLQQRIDEHAARPFDLARGPLFRAEILQLAKEDGQAEAGEAVYVLLINMHHIISDGWSLGVFVREWRGAYAAFAEGEPPALAPLAIQYTDYAAWQRQWLEGEILEGQLAWWKDNLAGIPDLLALPTDYPRLAEQDYRGNHYSQILPTDITAAIKDLSRAQGVTLYMTLLAAFDILLSRYSGQDDVCVGSGIANRTHTHTENLIGFFVNTLVLRTRLNPDQGFRELLQQVRGTCLDAYAHQDVPFEFLVEQLNPTRSTSHSPLFQASLAMQNFAQETFSLPELVITGLEQAYPIAKFDLTLYVWEQDGQLHFSWEYATSLFTEQTIRRMGEHFEVLLRGIIAEPETPISQLPLLTEAERRRILEWSHTQAPYPQDQCVHELFEAQVAKTPDAVAVVFEDEENSYEELNARANRLAHRLRALGVGPEVLVGLFVERSVEMVVGILAILKAGGAYVPLDPEYPLGRLALMAEDADLKVLLCHGETRERLPECAAHILDVDAEAAEIARESADDPDRITGPENLAYVIYTSGSTGKPKGVMVEHRNLCHSTWAREKYYESTGLEAFLLLSPVAFDSSVAGIFWSLTRGATLVLPEKQLDVSVLTRLVAKRHVTHMLCVPVLYHALLSQPEYSRLENLKVAIIAGESGSQNLLSQHYATLPDTTLFNEYGPTEGTVWSSAYRFETPRDKLSCIGKPITNARVYILDSELQPLPIGVPGEFCIGGAGVARGYLNHPELTAEKFIPDPFSEEPIGDGVGARLYRTGDSCRWFPDGNIEFLGRIDTQVKIRGFRIEPGEIEAMLTQHERVQEAAVIASEELEDKRLLAYFVPRPSDPLPDDSETIDAASKVEQWRQLYDDIYSQPTGSGIDLRFNTAGWNSSYTGAPIPREEMQEWLDGAVERILAKAPKRVLEIGCGSGMVVFRVAPRCEHYTATDFSPEVLGYLEQQKKTWEFGPRLTLLPRAADDFDGIEEGFYDGIILNSVVQYFPSIDYLLTVLTGTVTALAPGGFIFLGDVRNLQLLEELHASVQFHQADDSVSMAGLKQRVRRGMRKEEELLIDPDFFLALKRHLPQITHVQIQLKTGHAHNEMTRFRYDVTLHVGGGAPVDEATDGQFRRLDWQGEKLTLAKAREILAGDQSELIAFENIPNARLMTEKKILERLIYPEGNVGKLRESMTQPDDGIDPEEFRALIHELPYTSHTNYQGKYDYGVVFQHRDSRAVPYLEKAGAQKVGDLSERAWNTYANNPLQDAGDGHELVPQLRDFLKGKLPDYMVPSLFVPVEFLPLTPSGKIDRRALPAPDASDSPGTEYIAPISPTEELLARLWAGVLKRETIGRFDNFFDLGGHSLLATRLVSRIRTEFGMEIPIRALFGYPTIKEMADYMSTSSLNMKPGDALQEDEEEFAI